MTKLRVVNSMFLGLGLLACGTKPTKPAAESPAAAPRAVKTAAVERADGVGGSAPGTVRARKRATLAARIQASVVALPFREGESVAAGALAVRLDDTALRAALTAAEAAMASAEAELRRTQSLESKGAATPREKEEALARASGARAAWEAARDGLAYAALQAPFPARVARKHVSVGDVVSPGEALLELEGDDGYEIVAGIEGEVAPALAPGTSVEVRVDGLPEPLEARVTALSPAADPITHRFEVVAALPGEARLRSGLFARLGLPASNPSSRLTVPAGAVFERGGLSGVFVVADGRVRLRWIAAGATADERTEVRAGVEAGERIALEPAALRDGDSVTEAP
jgi:membrane fusion protein (multidrug efflux system)